MAAVTGRSKRHKQHGRLSLSSTNGLLMIVAIVTCLAATAVVHVYGAVGDYKYIYCYGESTTSLDLGGNQITYGAGELDIDNCASECMKLGFPYFGLQAATKCLCGTSYGKYGTSEQCTEVCTQTTGSGSVEYRCGGDSENDVYYTLKTDGNSVNARSDVFYTEGMTFEKARETCVKANGDLRAVTGNIDYQAVKTLLEEEGITSTKIWQGIWKQGTDYKWVNPTTVGSLAAGNSFWVSGETFANPCVTLDIATGDWQTTSCAASYPFVCEQAPAQADPTDETVTTTEATEESSFDMAQLSLYIVLPVFGLCYGGSCILYCSHKIYKSFKRKKRQKMLLSRLEDMPSDGTVTPTTEYEPDTKPKYEPARQNSGRPFSGNKRATVFPVMAPPVQSNGYFTQPPPPPPAKSERGISTPIEDIAIPSPRGEPEGEPTRDTPKDEDRPDTTRDVQLEMEPSPPPVVSANAIGTAAVAVDAMRPNPRRQGTQSAKTKADVRREKLLKKALQEARERRRQEGTPVPDHKPPTPNENQWAQPTGRGKPKYDDETDSGDSTVNLLSDNERGRSADFGRDPTTMSIQEILRMKVSSRKKPKKILSA